MTMKWNAWIYTLCSAYNHYNLTTGVSLGWCQAKWRHYQTMQHHQGLPWAHVITKCGPFVSLYQTDLSVPLINYKCKRLVTLLKEKWKFYFVIVLWIIWSHNWSVDILRTISQKSILQWTHEAKASVISWAGRSTHAFQTGRTVADTVAELFMFY